MPKGDNEINKDKRRKVTPSSINLRGTRKINNTRLPKILDYEAFILPPPTLYYGGPVIKMTGR